MKITLLYQVSHYIRVKTQRNIKSWDQQNDLVIRGFCYIRPLYNEVPLYCWYDPWRGSSDWWISFWSDFHQFTIKNNCFTLWAFAYRLLQASSDWCWLTVDGVSAVLQILSNDSNKFTRWFREAVHIQRGKNGLRIATWGNSNYLPHTFPFSLTVRLPISPSTASQCQSDKACSKQQVESSQGKTGFWLWIDENRFKYCWYGMKTNCEWENKKLIDPCGIHGYNITHKWVSSHNYTFILFGTYFI